MARKRRDPSVPAWAVACVLVLLAGALAVWIWRPPVEVPQQPVPVERWQAGPGDLEAFADSIGIRAVEVLIGLGVPRRAVTVRKLPENRGSAMRWEVRSGVPEDLPLAVCNLALTRLAGHLGGVVIEARQNLSGSQLSMLIGLGGERTNLVTLTRNPDLARTPGRIALIIDDVGYQDRDLIGGFCALKQPVSLSIFPGQERAGWISRQAVAGGHGVMVHLPMEPIDYPNQDPGPEAIFVDYSDERVREVTRKALASVPHAKGTNNHMGSRVTEDARTIGLVLKEVRRQGFFFVDSVTSTRSVAYAAAREMRVPCGRNSFFLDLKPGEAAVEEALNTLAGWARREGTVIGIGHAKPTTLSVLQWMLPELEGQGIAFVRVEDAVK